MTPDLDPPHDPPAAVSDELAALVDDLVTGARIVAWAEGIHCRTEYLVLRNAVIRHLVEQDAIRVVAAETSFVLSRRTDAYLQGHGAQTPTDRAVRGVWSWGRVGLLENARLIRWLRQHNADRPAEARVRFYGLDMYGFGAAGPPVLDDRPIEADDRRLAVALQARLAEHRARGGDHRDVAARDDAQLLTLQQVARRHADDAIFVFEQTEHLDRRRPGTLGAHLARGELGRTRTVGAVWRDGDRTVTYPLGPYQPISHWLTEHAADLTAAPGGCRVLDLRPWQGHPRASTHPAAGAATAFDAMVYAGALRVAEPSPAPTGGSEPP